MKRELNQAQQVYDVVRSVKDLLKEVNAIRGVDGSMVFTDDGILVTAVFGPGLLEETVAAVASRFILSTRQLVETLNFGKPSRFTLRSKQGVFALVPAGHAYLAVVGNSTFDAKSVQPNLTDAARQVRDIFKLNPPASQEKAQ